MMKKHLTPILASCIFIGACVPPGNEAIEPQNAITTSGEGKVQVIPDTATLQMGIEVKSPDVQNAQRQAEAVASRLVALTEKLGIEAKYVQTVSLTVRPEYRWDKDTNQQLLVGYIADRRIIVTLNDLDKLGALVEGAAESGINSISPPELTSSKAREAYREALERAAKDARDNAATLAGALDSSISSVLSITATQGGTQPRPMLRTESIAASDSGSGSSYMSGQITYSANVVAVFEIARR